MRRLSKDTYEYNLRTHSSLKLVLTVHIHCKNQEISLRHVLRRNILRGIIFANLLLANALRVNWCVSCIRGNSMSK